MKRALNGVIVDLKALLEVYDDILDRIITFGTINKISPETGIEPLTFYALDWSLTTTLTGLLIKTCVYNF